MKKVKFFVMLMAMAMASFSFVSCDDDPWDAPWYDDYGGLSWNDRYWNQGNPGGQGSQDSDQQQLAQALSHSWYGKVKFANYQNQEDGKYELSEFYARFEFVQSKNNSLGGTGTETDYEFDDNGNVTKTQTLVFSWYVDENSDIYVKYKSNDGESTYVMDASSNDYGYWITKDLSSFGGYLIGTGKAKGKVIYLDTEREDANTGSNAKASTRAITTSDILFGKGAAKKLASATSHKLVKER